MESVHKLEIVASFFVIITLSIFLFSPYIKITGHVSGVNVTFYTQTLDILVDSSKSYSLVADNPLNLKSFMISGEVLGEGRVEILLDDGQGTQYLVYDNVIKKITPRSFITGRALDETQDVNENADVIIEKSGLWFVVNQKSKSGRYEFRQLEENEEIKSGKFLLASKETKNLPKGVFSDNYELVFRLEQGTSIKIDEVKYTLYEENS